MSGCFSRPLGKNLPEKEEANTEVVTVPTVYDITVTTNEDVSVLINLEYVNPLSTKENFYVRNVPGDGQAEVVIADQGLFRYIPDPDFSGIDFFRVQFSSGDELSNIALVTINIAATNDAPTSSTINKVTTPEDSPFVVSFDIDDTDSVVACNGTYLSLNSLDSTKINASNVVWGGAFPNCQATITPEPNQIGSLQLELIVSDLSASSSQFFDVLLENTNDAPVLSTISNRTINEDNSEIVTFTFSDIDSLILCNSSFLSIASTNTGLIDSSDVSFTGTVPNCTMTLNPKTDQFGSAIMTLTGSDGTLIDSSVFTLTVNSVSDAPTVVAPQNQIIAPGTLSNRLGFTISDPEEPITCSSNVTATSSDTSLITNANITVFPGGPANQNCEIQFQTEAAASGLVTITITASDGTLTGSDTFSVSVDQGNIAPVVEAIADIDHLVNQNLLVDGNNIVTGSDIDENGDTLTWTCFYDTLVDGMVTGANQCNGLTNVVFNSNTGVLSFTPSSINGQIGDFEFRFEATDGVFTDDEVFVVSVSASQIWRFTNPSNYTYNTNHLSLVQNNASLNALNLKYDSTTDYNATTISGLIFDTNKLTHGDGGACNGLTHNCENLDSVWTPSWSDVQLYLPLDNSLTEVTGNSGAVSSTSQAFSSDSKIGTFGAEFFNDGSTDELISVASNGNISQASNFSVSFWVKSLAANNDSSAYVAHKTIGGVPPAGTGNWLIQQFGADPRLSMRLDTTAASNQIFTTESDVFDNQFHHVVMVIDSGNIYGYVDGVQEISTAYVTGDGLANMSQNLIIGGSGTTSEMAGIIDEFAYWSLSLSQDQVKNIYSRQRAKYAGHVVSDIIDSGLSTYTWSHFAWNSTVPFLKDIPFFGTNESTNDYSSLVGTTGSLFDDDLTVFLFGAWHFNGNALDRGGANGAATVNGSPEYVQANTAVGSHAIKLSSISLDSLDLATIGLTSLENYTSSMWFRINTDSGSTSTLFHRGNDNECFYNPLITFNPATDQITVQENGCAAAGVVGNYPIERGKWNHLAVRRAGQNVDVFLNGKNVGFDNSQPAIVPTIAGKIMLGGTYSNTGGVSNHFDGFIDEVVFWQRALDTEEIIQLYRRGANKVLFQIRTCSDAACSGEPWVGATGENSFMTELQNNSFMTLGNVTGNVLATAPFIPMGSFLNPPAANQYFQWQTILQSEDEGLACDSGLANCYPDLESVSLFPRTGDVVTGPEITRYYGGVTTLENATALSFSALSNISITEVGKLYIKVSVIQRFRGQLLLF